MPSCGVVPAGSQTRFMPALTRACTHKCADRGPLSKPNRNTFALLRIAAFDPLRTWALYYERAWMLGMIRFSIGDHACIPVGGTSWIAQSWFASLFVGAWTETLSTAIILTMTGCGGFGMQWRTAGRPSLFGLAASLMFRRS